MGQPADSGRKSGTQNSAYRPGSYLIRKGSDSASFGRIAQDFGCGSHARQGASTYRPGSYLKLKNGGAAPVFILAPSSSQTGASRIQLRFPTAFTYDAVERL